MMIVVTASADDDVCCRGEREMLQFLSLESFATQQTNESERKKVAIRIC